MCMQGAYPQKNMYTKRGKIHENVTFFKGGRIRVYVERGMEKVARRHNIKWIV